MILRTAMKIYEAAAAVELSQRSRQSWEIPCVTGTPCAVKRLAFGRLQTVLQDAWYSASLPCNILRLPTPPSSEF
jgi:hypothetical protein